MKSIIKSLTLASVMTIGLTIAVAVLPASVQAQDGPVFELRTYKATPGNLEKLMARFRDHTMRIFEKHGMTNIGYWLPTDEIERQDTLIYLLKHDSMEAATASWRAFSQDPEWRQVNEDSNRDGAILDSVVRKYMTATDFSQMK
ncbi:MAG: NIPSNAP family protein [Pseudohongiella sp.]|nr:NIPSNAP family protein [Pseudohongiella sp.]